MNINESNLFAKTLLTASSQGLYISQTDNGFSPCSDKNAKNLNTVKIAELAEECLEHYKNPEFSEQKKAVLMKGLRLSIKKYRKRLYKSKPWYAKIASCFGFMSREEGRLKTVAEQTHDHQNKIFKEIETAFKEAYSNYLDDATIQNRKFAIQVLESKDFREKPTEGLPAGLGIISYLQNLRNLPHQTEQVTKAITLLENALSLLSIGLAGNFPLISNGPSEDEALSEYNKRLKENIDNLEVGKQTIFFGTASNGAEIGHVVLYQVSRLDQDNYALAVFNAQLDTEECIQLMSKSREPVTLANYSTILAKHRPKKKTLRANVKLDFFDNHFIQNTFKKVKTVAETANENFLSHLATLENFDGKDHAAGTTNSCGFKPISSWLNEMLGNDYQEFKVFLTERELAEHAQSSHAHKNLFLTKGHEVLAHRKQKLPVTSSATK